MLASVCKCALSAFLEALADELPRTLRTASLVEEDGTWRLVMPDGHVLSDASFRVDAEGVHTADAQLAAALAAVRPEDFTVVGETGDNTIEAVVEIVEYHGREQAVEARLRDGTQLHVRTQSRLAPGDTVTLKVPAERVLVFA